VAATFEAGASSGMMIVAGMPSRLADSAIA